MVVNIVWKLTEIFKMDSTSLSYAALVFTTTGSLIFLYFLAISWRTLTTISNIQIAVMFASYISLTVSVYFYFTTMWETLTDSQVPHSIAAIFVNALAGLCEISYIQLSWTRATAILSFGNKTVFKICNIFVKLSFVIYLLPSFFVGLYYGLKMPIFFDIQSNLNAFIALLMVIFDGYLLYRFSEFFGRDASNRVNDQPRIIAKYGIIGNSDLSNLSFSFCSSRASWIRCFHSKRRFRFNDFTVEFWLCCFTYRSTMCYIGLSSNED